ncbi:MAG: acyl carrier protein [Bacteroidetes bacterium]|nr:acyl carrier protein [Bacteroidota bacterium]
MEHEEVKQKVKKAVSEILKINQSDIDDDANFVLDLGADSIQSIQMVAAFEEEFDIEMDEDGAVSVQTISGAVDFIAGYLD